MLTSVTAAHSASGVTCSISSWRPTPSASIWAALENPSVICGTATIGTPLTSPSEVPPIPAWVTNASEVESWARIASCGTQRCTSMLAGTSPRSAGSTCWPIDITTCQSVSPKARTQSAKKPGWLVAAEPRDTSSTGRFPGGRCQLPWWERSPMHGPTSR